MSESLFRQGVPSPLVPVLVSIIIHIHIPAIRFLLFLFDADVSRCPPDAADSLFPETDLAVVPG